MDVFIFQETFNTVEIIGAIIVIGCTLSNIAYTVYLKQKTESVEKFKQISEAYTVLSDYNSKIKYDNNYNLESYETYVNPFDLFEEVIKKSDILTLDSKINNWLYSDFDIEDKIDYSPILKKNNYSRSIRTEIYIKDNKKYTKKIIRENGKEKVFENFIDLNSNKHIPF